MNERANLKKGVLVTVILCAAIFNFFSSANAQTRRALLVGINRYTPGKPLKKPVCRGEWRNLSGCINDVKAMKGILISRYYFKPENIKELLDETATKVNILSSIERHLIDEASPGDICVFYFSGHGSKVRNSKSTEPDKKDESLVPFDWYRINRDIRDKELKKLFNRVLDKGARLTVIVDACHSGSISRGIPSPFEIRALPENECDVAEPPDNEKEPAERGAVVLSAARDYQNAFSVKIEEDRCHGAFTWTMLGVLRCVPFDEPVESIMQRVNALMQSEGIKSGKTQNKQEPNLEGLRKHMKQSLFGEAPARDFGIAAGVAEVEVGMKRIKLLAGYAAGIRKNCELQKISMKENETPVRVRVDEVYGLNLCRAKVFQGNVREVKEGDLFRIYRWIAPREAKVKVFIPESSLTHSELLGISHAVEALKESGLVEWVTDPTVMTPTHIMCWDSKGWCLDTLKGEKIALGKNPNAGEILKTIRQGYPAGSEVARFFLHLPLSSETRKLIMPEVEYYSDSINKLSSNKEAHYILVGNFSEEEITYAWIQPNMVEKERGTGALPIRTKWTSVTEDSKVNRRYTAGLFDDLLRLVKVRAWLRLTSPRGKEDFPYDLVLKNTHTGEVKTSGPLVEDELYGMALQSSREQPGGNGNVYGRYVYVFSIDSCGKGRLLFPPKHRRNSENYFPVDNKYKKEIRLWDRDLFTIGRPFGLDTYFLLTTEEAISNLEVFNFKGVRGDSPPGEYNALERLLYGLGSGYRGNPPATYTNWSIEHMQILSIPKKR